MAQVHSENVGKDQLSDEKVEDQKRNNLGDTFKNVDFNPDFSYFEKNKKPATFLQWNSISFNIKDKSILTNVTGSVKGGELLALMGPSGAGKSSLMNILAGRVISGRKKVLKGEVSINGEKINPSIYRKNIAYVLQEDSLFATATAKESLEFSARLRLPADTKTEERNEIVEGLLAALGLTHVKDTMVGSEMIRGLSGGEKKRVAIAVELVTNPNLLFLDEPTSGLDSFSAWKVVRILQKMSNATGCAVLCTIHQPSSEIFNMFSKTMVLAKGTVMYNGNVESMPDILETLGWPLPALTNPADFIMLIAQTCNDDDLPHYNVEDNEESTSSSEIMHTDSVSSQRKVGFFVQASWLARREFRNFYRDVGFLVANIVITVFLNLLFGAVFYQAANPDESGYNVRGNYGALLLVLVSAMFGAAQGPLLTFPLERSVMIREYQTGTYGSFPYLLSKLMIEIPRYFFISLLVLLSAYWLIGYNGNFFLLLLTIFAIELCSASYAFVIASAVSDAKQGQEFAPLLLVPQLLFTGLFVPISVIPEWLRWVQYVCVLKYGVNLGAIVEFGDCESDDPDYVDECTAIFETNDIERDDIWSYCIILAAIFVVFRSLSLCILVFRAKHFTK